MLLANFNGKEHLRHRAVSLRQHGFLVLNARGMRKTVQDVVFRFPWYRTKWEKRTNGTYTDLESVSIASALSTTLTIYPCQIRVHQRWQSKLQLPTARKKEWRPATAGSSPSCGYLCRQKTRWCQKGSEDWEVAEKYLMHAPMHRMGI